jgi:hypothetical protein
VVELAVVLADEARATRSGAADRVSSDEGLVVDDVLSRGTSRPPTSAEAPWRTAVVWVVIRHAGR